jgi:LacI family transcriptional regulator
MSSTAPSLRDLAKTLGLSHTTVSEALRDNPRVKAETRCRVHAAAKAANYHYNPLAGALMSEMRRSRTTSFRGVIAIVDLDGPKGRPTTSARYHRELTKGAIERAGELGFKAELFIVGHDDMTPQRLDIILQSRGIRAVFLLPVSESPDVTKLDWSRYAGIYTDYVIEHPALHNICPNHYRAMLMAMQNLQDLGYRRPGLVLQKHHDVRLFHRWEAAYWTHQNYYNSDKTKIPVLTPPEIERASFSKWFKKYNPDVVLCHRADVIEWMRGCGAKIPQTHGFCCLNTMMHPDVACAGLNLQPRLLGARGIELVIGQLYRNEYGIPDLPSTTTVPAIWVDGLTVRRISPKK